MLTQETTAPPSLGRTRDPEGTRALLVENAFREIHAHGYAGASLDRILANTGVTKGALYHHFKSKADLLHAVIDDAIQPMVVERWLGPLEESNDPIRTLAESTRTIMAEATPEEMCCGCPLNNLTQELAGVDEDFRKHLDRLADDWRAGIRAAFDDAIQPMVVERWLGPLEESNDPIRTLAESTRTIMAEATPEEMCCGCPLNNLTQELAGVDEDFRKHLDRLADDWRAGIRAAFERGQEAGNIRKDVDTAAVASLVFATYQGLIGSVKTSHDQDAVTAGLSMFLDLLEGLRP